MNFQREGMAAIGTLNDLPRYPNRARDGSVESWREASGAAFGSSGARRESDKSLNPWSKALPRHPNPTPAH